MKFREVPPGSRFEYQGRIYSKVRLNLAKDDQQKTTIFPSEAEVSPCHAEQRSPEASARQNETPKPQPSNSDGK